MTERGFDNTPLLKANKTCSIFDFNFCVNKSYFKVRKSKGNTKDNIRY